jgi:hypothetical protein
MCVQAEPGVVVTKQHISVINRLLPVPGPDADTMCFHPDTVWSLTDAKLEGAARQYLQDLSLDRSMPVIVASNLQQCQLDQQLRDAVKAAAAAAADAKEANGAVKGIEETVWAHEMGRKQATRSVQDAARKALAVAKDRLAHSQHAAKEANKRLKQLVLQQLQAGDSTACEGSRSSAYVGKAPIPDVPPFVVFHADLPSGMLYGVHCKGVSLKQARNVAGAPGGTGAGVPQLAVVWHYLQAPRPGPSPAAREVPLVEVSCSTTVQVACQVYGDVLCLHATCHKPCMAVEHCASCGMSHASSCHPWMVGRRYSCHAD